SGGRRGGKACGLVAAPYLVDRVHVGAAFRFGNPPAPHVAPQRARGPLTRVNRAGAPRASRRPRRRVYDDEQLGPLRAVFASDTSVCADELIVFSAALTVSSADTLLTLVWNALHASSSCCCVSPFRSVKLLLTASQSLSTWSRSFW